MTSVGLHGDDGNEYLETGYNGVEICRCWKKGDVVGFGTFCKSATICNYFYTLNGKIIQPQASSKALSFPRIPCVGFQRTGESCFVNLGHKPFKFDLVSYIKAISRS